MATPIQVSPILKYPGELNTNVIDYVIFSAHEYRTNQIIPGSDFSPDASPPPKRGSVIQLFMPNSTPAIGNDNGWDSSDNFQGPLGAIKRDLGSAATNIITGGMSSGDDWRNAGKDMARQIAEIAQGTGGAAQQTVLNAVAGITGTNANTLLAITKGQIYNPNVEMIYGGPKIRSFSFDYIFLPKNINDAINMNRIIKEFKKWSSPLAKEGSYYEIPAVWEVKYMTRGEINKNMNLFKKAALQSVAVQANSQIDIHMAYENGTPISTTMRLNFIEVDVITRKDHEDSENYQGY